MKTVWSDKLMPLLNSRRGAFIIEFVMGAVLCAALLGLAGLVMWLHQVTNKL